jgi:hypothetical protein
MGGLLVAVGAAVGVESVAERDGMLGLVSEQAIIARAAAVSARRTNIRRMGGV